MTGLWIILIILVLMGIHEVAELRREKKKRLDKVN